MKLYEEAITHLKVMLIRILIKVDIRKLGNTGTHYKKSLL